MTLRTRIAALAGAIGLSLLIAFAALTAAGPAGTLAAVAATPATGSQASATEFLAKLAANLGIGQDKLTEAVKQTNLQVIDEAVAAGTMTAEQAQAARDRVNSGIGGLSFGGGPRGGERGGFGGGMLDEATASFFGISADQLRQDLAATGTLQGVAAKYGKDNDAGKAALKAALESALRQQLTGKGVEATQIDQRVGEFSQNFDQYYTSQRHERGPRGPQQTPAPSASPAQSQ